MSKKNQNIMIMEKLNPLKGKYLTELDYEHESHDYSIEIKESSYEPKSQIKIQLNLNK
mgnify:CR=1 FL=1